MMFLRLLVVGVSLVATSGYLRHASRPERLPPRMPLASFPSQMGPWTAKAAPDFDRGVVAALGVDEYVNRFYVTASDLAHVYIGYYRSQQEGSTIHSPMNCLPGAGWTPIVTGRTTLQVEQNGAPAAVEVNRVVIQKGLDRQVVLYWYESHGRTIASEYWSKIYLVLDAIRLNRSDAALVRIVVPIDTSRPDGELAAERAAVDLAGNMFPSFTRFLSS